MRTVIGACLALLASAYPARAQLTFRSVQPGALPTLFVTDRAGHETRGKLVRITDTEVTIAADGGDRTFAVSDVLVIDRKGDSLRNGAIVGMVVGMAFGVLSAGIPSDCPAGECPGMRAYGFVFSTAVYTAIGTAIDAAVQGRTRVWTAREKASGAPVVAVSPADRRVFIGWRISR
jgi:hypothetical protein